MQVYHIQDHLINMVANGTLENGTDVSVTLEDICYKPLSPDNTNCTIMSVLNYFQNDLSRLDYTEDFGLINNSYHIYYCTRYIIIARASLPHTSVIFTRLLQRSDCSKGHLLSEDRVPVHGFLWGTNRP